MTKLSWRKKACAVVVLCTATGIAARAQVFNDLNLGGTNGALPGSLVQGPDGNFYGTTAAGGANISDHCQLNAPGCGTIFKITPGGALATLYNFCGQPNCADGTEPTAGLVLGTDGNFYGTTNAGGYRPSTVFKIAPGGTLTTLYTFCSQANCADGFGPTAALVQGTDGNFYGTTAAGGAADKGTVFKITPAGVLTTLYSFCSQPDCGDGAFPYAGLIQATDGNFYGTTSEGGPGELFFCGTAGCGTIFKMTPAGKLTTLYIFCGCGDGALPDGGVVQGSDGNFYGTTVSGGDTNFVSGSIFKITPGGTFTSLYSFCAQTKCVDGERPTAGLIQATDGNFYGTAAGGGAYGYGTAFEFTPSGILTTLHSFDGFDGEQPSAGLLQATDGTFYGTASEGGNFNCGEFGCGTLFSLSMGLGPFVTFVRSYGKVGQTGGILGQGFTETTSVSLNGTSASFKVLSDTFLEATVPAGGTTGFVTVTTQSGPLTSNVSFRVLPQLLSFNPPSGLVGTVVTIKGVSLTQTTGVGFGDYTPASFTVNSDTQVTATVPQGAATGPVGIQTQGGIAISSATFTVTP